jgi:hypothetical protein
MQIGSTDPLANCNGETGVQKQPQASDDPSAERIRKREKKSKKEKKSKREKKVRV